MSETYKRATIKNPAFWVCLTITIGLFVAGFCVPPHGEIDGSILTAGGILFAFATLETVHVNNSVGDDVEVSLLHVDSTTYAYWRGYADSKELGFSLLFNVTTPLDGNILGGHGIWYGCGMGRKTLNLKPSTTGKARAKDK
jgi:hypothetical protein